MTKTDVAAVTGLALKTITRVEADDVSASPSAISRIRAMLVVRGAEFVEDANGYGVRLRPGIQNLETERSTQLAVVRPLIEVDVADADRIDAAQSRAARGFLDWTREQTIPSLGVGLSTLQDFENGRRLPTDAIMRRIISGFSQAGVTFSRSNLHLSVHLASQNN